MRKRLLRVLTFFCAAALSFTAAATPAVSISRAGPEVKIDFTGALQTASAPEGPWLSLSNAVTPLVLAAPAGRSYFRSVEPAAQSIFTSTQVVSLTAAGPFQTHFELAFAGMPDGIFPPTREKPYFDGLLTLSNRTIPVSYRVRGNSSLQECPFPKLKFKVSRTDRLGTPFFDAREVKIGTHCAEGGRGPIGRLREQAAVYREALAYETMGVLGFVSPRVRRAQFDYHDTSPTNRESEVGWTLSRNALLLDDIEVVAERLGGRALDDEEISQLTNANFSVQLVAELQLFQTLLGNWDYALGEGARGGVWNMDVIEMPDGRMIPVSGDFDLSSWVTERVRLSAPWDYRPELPELDRQAQYDVERIRAHFGADVFFAARVRFEEHRAAVAAQVEHALVDDAGRASARAHLDAFYRALSLVTR